MIDHSQWTACLIKTRRTFSYPSHLIPGCREVVSHPLRCSLHHAQRTQLRLKYPLRSGCIFRNNGGQLRNCSYGLAFCFRPVSMHCGCTSLRPSRWRWSQGSATLAGEQQQSRPSRWLVYDSVFMQNMMMLFTLVTPNPLACIESDRGVSY
jgi:hypothetical protein